MRGKRARGAPERSCVLAQGKESWRPVAGGGATSSSNDHGGDKHRWEDGIQLPKRSKKQSARHRHRLVVEGRFPSLARAHLSPSWPLSPRVSHAGQRTDLPGPPAHRAQCLRPGVLVCPQANRDLGAGGGDCPEFSLTMCAECFIIFFLALPVSSCLLIDFM